MTVDNLVEVLREQRDRYQAGERRGVGHWKLMLMKSCRPPQDAPIALAMAKLKEEVEAAVQEGRGSPNGYDWRFKVGDSVVYVGEGSPCPECSAPKDTKLALARRQIELFPKLGRERNWGLGFVQNPCEPYDPRAVAYRREFPKPGAIGVVVKVGRWELDFVDFPWCDGEGCDLHGLFEEDLDSDCRRTDHIKVLFPNDTELCSWESDFRPVMKLSGDYLGECGECGCEVADPAHHFVLRIVYVGLDETGKVETFSSRTKAEHWASLGEGRKILERSIA